MQKYTSSINLHSKTLKSESLNEKKMIYIANFTLYVLRLHLEV